MTPEPTTESKMKRITADDIARFFATYADADFTEDGFAEWASDVKEATLVGLCSNPGPDRGQLVDDICDSVTDAAKQSEDYDGARCMRADAEDFINEWAANLIDAIKEA